MNVSQSVADGCVKIEIAGNGECIDPGNLTYVCERYYKVDSLSIVKKIINLHGGRYGVESEPDKGNCFRFEISAG